MINQLFIKYHIIFIESENQYRVVYFLDKLEGKI